MSMQNIRRLAKSDYLKLVPILTLAFYLAFIPHLDYPYPVHIDEWVHWEKSNAMLGASAISLTLETGFQLFLAVFHQISGISWLTIFRYFPSIIFMITVLSVYVLARREGFGWEAAFFTTLIPTTVGIMGPAFLVPVAMGLLFTPLILFLAFNFRTVWSYLLIFVFISFLVSMHAPSAIVPIIVLTPYIILNLKSNFRHSFGITLALVVPFLGIFPLVFARLLPTARSLLTPQPLEQYVQLPRVIETFGYLPLGFCLLGTFLLAISGGKKNYGLILGLLVLLLMLVTFFTFHYGVPIMYHRGLMYMMLMVGIVAGAGLMGVKNLRLPERFGAWLKVPFITQNMGVLLCLALIVTTLAIAIPDRQDTPYYHMIDRQDYESFVWIRDNLNEEYKKVILDPWKATAFTAITGKSVYTRIHMAPLPKDNKAYVFLRGGSANTTFLRENGISIIYTRVYDGVGNTNYSSDNPNLVELAKNVYLLKESE